VHAYYFSRDYLRDPDYAILVPALKKTEMKDSGDAWGWINRHFKQINHLLERMGRYDPEYGLILVTERWSAKNSGRIAIPRKEIEGGIVIGFRKDGTWAQGVPLEGDFFPSKIEYFDVRPLRIF
jgi:hypothetical protein